MFLKLARTGDQRRLTLVRLPEGLLVTGLSSAGTAQAELFAAPEVHRLTAAGF